jgi:hypothetical protein
MIRGAAVFFLLALSAAMPAPAARAGNCYTTQSASGEPPAVAAQFRIARRAELVDWARGAKSLSDADTHKLDALRAQVEQARAAKHWSEAEAAINEAMKLLGIVNKAESALPGC